MTCADSSNSAPRLLLALNGADERLQLVLGRLPDAPCDAPAAHQPNGPETATFLVSQEWTVPGQAVRFLTPGIRHMLDCLGFQAQCVRRIACVHGPGSFTGLRMSLAAAEGFAAGSGALLAGVDHLALLAHEAAELMQAAEMTEAHGAVLALAWSRRGQVYAQAFARGKQLSPPQVVMLAAMPELLAALPRPLAMLGGGLRKNLPFFAELAQNDPGLRLLPPAWDTPRPETLLSLAAQAQFGPGPLQPAYLRASDAEENLAGIAAGRGLSEAEAQEILGRGSRTLS